MEPEVRGILYPKREETATSEDLKITIAVISTILGIILITCLVLSPRIYHTLVHGRDRFKDYLKRKKNKRRVFTIELDSRNSEQLAAEAEERFNQS